MRQYKFSVNSLFTYLTSEKPGIREVKCPLLKERHPVIQVITYTKQPFSPVKYTTGKEKNNNPTTILSLNRLQMIGGHFSHI